MNARAFIKMPFALQVAGGQKIGRGFLYSMSKWIHNLQKKITHGTDIQPNGRPLNERQGLRKNAVRSTGSGRPKKSVEGFYSRSKWIQKKHLGHGHSNIWQESTFMITFEIH